MHKIRILNTVTVVVSLRKIRSLKDCPAAVGLFLCSTVTFSVFYALLMYSGCPGFSRSDYCRSVLREAFLVRNASGGINSTWDYENLIDLKNFTFLINVPPCDEMVSLLIIVHTKTVNFAKRATIRKTWGSVVDEKFRLVFFVGTTRNRTIQGYLEKEHKRHGDTVQGSFVDSYRNLTYKHIMGFKWKEYFCPSVSNVLKTDDDVFINLPMLLGMLPETPSEAARGLMICNPQIHPRAYRTARSKWKVTQAEYEFRRYPTFCEGFVILYSSDVVTQLYLLAQRARYLWVDDVLVTGILAQFTEVTPMSIEPWKLCRRQVFDVINGSLSLDSFLIGPSNLKKKAIEGLWERVPVSEEESEESEYSGGGETEEE